jgi:hypothetical protein
LAGNNQIEQIEKGDEIMKKHFGIVFIMAACVVGFIGQLAAFGANTNSVWDVTAISTLKAPKLKVIETNAATAVFLDDGTCAIVVGSDEFDGTYTNTSRTLKMAFTPGGVVALESNAFDFATAQVPPEITVTITKTAKLPSIQLKDGVPVKLTAKVSGKGSAVVRGRTASRNFTVTDLLVNWTLSSGLAF